MLKIDEASKIIRQTIALIRYNIYLCTRKRVTTLQR